MNILKYKNIYTKIKYKNVLLFFFKNFLVYITEDPGNLFCAMPVVQMELINYVVMLIKMVKNGSVQHVTMLQVLFILFCFCSFN